MKPIALSTLALVASAALVSASDVFPIVEVESNDLIGAYTGGKWLVSEKAAKLVKPGTSYRVYSLTRDLGKAQGGKSTPGADMCPEVFTVELSPKNEKGVIAIAAPWNALPRTPRLADVTQPIYVQAVREFLQSRGIRSRRSRSRKSCVSTWRETGRRKCS